MVLFEKHIHFRDNIVKLKKEIVAYSGGICLIIQKTNRKKEWDAYLAVFKRNP